MSLISIHSPRRLRKIVFAVCFAAVFLTSFSPAIAQDDDSIGTTQPEIVATVNGNAITADQVERDMSRTLQGIKLNPSQKTAARAATLDKLINQHVAFEFLKKHGIAAGDEEVNLQLEELKAELATVEKTIDDYLIQTTQTLDELQFQTAWQISWKRYLARQLTDEFLESHFNQNKRSMDGTELRVAHLLLKAPQNVTTDQIAALSAKAQAIAEQINKTSLTWEAAVAQHSQAPTRNSGGEIGWIKIDGPMPRSFTRMAFELSTGKLSQPVTTRFGVHIIKCLEVKEGKLGWRDIIDDVKKSASRGYFDAIVEKHRPEVTINK